MSRARKWLSTLFVVLWLLMVAGIVAVRWELLPLQVGLLSASGGALLVFLYGVLLLPVVLYKAVLRKPLAAGTVTTCILGLLPVGVLLVTVGPAGFRAPAIHDISTDTLNPPPFVLAAEQRAEGDNPVEYGGEVTARLQDEAYPDIGPLQVAASPQQVLQAAAKVMKDKGWQVLGVRNGDTDGVAGYVEGVATSAIFGFEDDVVVRVSATAGGSRVDIRSASRVGLGDLGANAARIRDLAASLEENL